jgi:diguanylate cyclase (GGDEF)-like protein
LLETALTEARCVAERVRQAIAKVTVATDQGLLGITISLGIASLTADVPNLAALLDDADSALYLAKKGGKNRAEVIS